MSPVGNSLLSANYRTAFIVKSVFSFLLTNSAFGYYLRAQQLKTYNLVRGTITTLLYYFCVQFLFSFQPLDTALEGASLVIANFITLVVLL